MVSIVWTCLFYAWFVGEIVIAIATRTRQNSGKVRDRGSQLILWVVIITSVTACEVVRHLLAPNIFGKPPWIGPLSLFLLATGLSIRTVAILTLGKSFSANVAIKDLQTVLKTGLYQFVRHPSYVGLLIIFLAIGLHSRNWLCLALAFAPTSAALLYRIHIEEAALRDAFGDDYVAYSKTTKRLIPGIY
jgi:protein-S-isoprenylcysteine O-methyltransferase Ste14